MPAGVSSAGTRAFSNTVLVQSIDAPFGPAHVHRENWAPNGRAKDSSMALPAAGAIVKIRSLAIAVDPKTTERSCAVY